MAGFYNIKTKGYYIMALIKDEWVIRKTSTATIAKANASIRTQLDAKQTDPTNLDMNGKYIDNFLADLFDSRDGSLYRIFSTGATNNTTVIAGDASNGIDGYYKLIKTADYITQSDLVPFAKTSELPDFSLYKVASEIVQIVDSKIDAINIDTVIIG